MTPAVIRMNANSPIRKMVSGAEASRPVSASLLTEGLGTGLSEGTTITVWVGVGVGVTEGLGVSEGDAVGV